MDDKHFHPAVEVIEVGSGFKVMHVNTTRQAAEMLLDPRWPNPKSKKARSARQACLDVLEGQRDAAEARKAFRDAAEEADLLVTKGMLSRKPVPRVSSKK